MNTVANRSIRLEITPKSAGKDLTAKDQAVFFVAILLLET